jgi:hemoglobin/transferrin/lactoferrin receptor protein
VGVSSAALTASGVLSARAQDSLVLEPITVLATKTPEKTTEALAAVSSVRQDQLDQLMPGRASDVLFGVPGVWFQERADDPGSAVNIRGLQDFGRVAVVIDGARQNFQRTGHNADGVFYLDPELIGGVDVVRGPVANIYGSGAIGGVVSFSTKDVDDVLRPGQTWAVLKRGEVGSNMFRGSGSAFAAFRPNDKFDFMFGGVFRSVSNYEDGNGNLIQNTGHNDWSGIAKATFRPADGHQLKFGLINFETRYKTGQPPSSVYGTDVANQIATARWTYSKPDDRIFDFDGSAYWTRTATDQTKLEGAGNAASGFIGDSRKFTIDTIGFDTRNTSRFDLGPWRHALTYGADGFRDEVNTTGFGTVFTPSGERTVSGGFVQLKSNYSTWLEVIGAVRYDRYELNGGGFSSSGDRISPKVTVGVTPVRWITPYVTYAEGYRAPAITETLVVGTHPVFPQFDLLPNPLLRPEVGKTKEAGVNLRFDDVLKQGDALRAKANVYRNDVDDFIEFTLVNFGSAAVGGTVCTNMLTLPFPPIMVPGFCEQYQNIPHARLEGVELESSYDAGAWFGGINYSHVRGRNADTGAPLAKIPPDSVTTTIGARFLDRKLTLALRWQWVAAKTLDEIPTENGTPVFPPTDSYNLVNFYAGYQPNQDVLASFAVENLFNQQYSRFMTSYPNPSGTGTGIAFPQPGITVKGSLKVRFSEDVLRKG